MAKVKFLQKRVKIQGHPLIFFLQTERSCHKEYTCDILKPYLLWLKNYGQS